MQHQFTYYQQIIVMTLWGVFLLFLNLFYSMPNYGLLIGSINFWVNLEQQSLPNNKGGLKWFDIFIFYKSKPFSDHHDIFIS